MRMISCDCPRFTVPPSLSVVAVIAPGAFSVCCSCDCPRFNAPPSLSVAHPQGCRDAQCGWLEVPTKLVSARLAQQQSGASRPHPRRGGTSSAALEPCSILASGDPPLGTSAAGEPPHSALGEDLSSERGEEEREPLLAVYSPRRQLVELWQARPGIRLLALAGVGAHCQLLEARVPLRPSELAADRLLVQQGVSVSSKTCANKEQDLGFQTSWSFDDDSEDGASAGSPVPKGPAAAAADCCSGDRDSGAPCLFAPGRAGCFLFDGARGTITDLCSSLARAASRA